MSHPGFRTGLIGVAQVLALTVALPAQSLDLSALTLPEGTIPTGRQQDDQGVFALPSAVFDGQSVPMTPVTGQRIQQAWSVPLGTGTTAFDLFDGLAEQITAQEYDIDLTCQAEDCGGFDFRQALDLLPPPQMFVDLSEFYALRGTRMGAQGAETTFLLVSRTDQGITVQITGVGAQVIPKAPTSVTGVPTPSTGPAPAPVQIAPMSDAQPTGSTPPGATLATKLDGLGHAVLEGVTFASGGSRLEARPASLQTLADYLRSRPGRRAAIVGHSDSTGSIAANLALSKQRAAAVRQVLVQELGVSSAQLSAEGVGPLAPRDTNATEEGRARNRRVEVVVLTP